MACACRMISCDGNVLGEFYEDAGPDGQETPGGNLTSWVEKALKMARQVPLEEHLCIILHKDNNGDAEYVINMMTKYIGDFLLSGGHKKDGRPVRYWEQWKRISEFCLSRCPEPTWDYAQNDPQVNYVANSVQRLLI